MRQWIRARQDLLLLLSLLLLIVMNPLLDSIALGRLFIALLTFLPLTFATIKMSRRPRWLWTLLLLMTAFVVLRTVGTFYPNQLVRTADWIVLAVFFLLASLGLFSYLRSARVITTAHLHTAASIYLLLGMQWFAIYGAFEAVRPGAFLRGSSFAASRQSDLLYFSLVTLSTIGYGDIVPLNGEARMMAALEGITGVLYIAITVALLVSSYRQGNGTG